MRNYITARLNIVSNLTADEVFDAIVGSCKSEVAFPLLGLAAILTFCIGISQ